MHQRALRRTAVAWLPVACLLGAAVTTAPATSRVGQSGALTVTPRDFYGGQAVTFRGSTGRQGRTPIWLEFHMGRSGDSWTRIEGSGRRTATDGSFSFQFPARGMLNIKVRVAWRGGATPPELFRAHDQAVSLVVQPADDRLYRSGPCSASYRSFLSYETVSDEPSTIVVDTVAGGGPVLAGRTVTLQQRVGADRWRKVGSGSVGADGTYAFRDVQVTGSTAVAYRVRMEPWTRDGSEIGWFPSFPTYLDPLHRPAAVASPSASEPAVDPSLGAPHPEVLDLGWTLPGDEEVAEVVVAWNRNGSPVTDLARADEARRLYPASGTVVDGLVPAQQYQFSVHTRSRDGICSPPRTTTATTAPAPTPAPVTALTASADWDHVDLTWELPALAASFDRVAVTRVAGPGPAAPPRTGSDVAGAADLGSDVTSFTDRQVDPSTTYTYGVFVQNRWGVWSVVTDSGSRTTTTRGTVSASTGRVARGALMVVLLVAGALVLPGTAGDRTTGPAQPTGQPAAHRAGVPATPASQKYGWAPSLFDFAWEYGESLTDRPGRGTKRRGEWLDTTTGSGRAARHNGGLMLQSKYGVVAPGDAGPGDHGTTSIVLRGNAQTYGRWEVRAATWGWSDPGEHYRTLVELVPEADPGCRARSITVADLARDSSTLRFGAYAQSGRRAWTGTRAGVRQGERSDAHSYAVEVAKGHVTWFVDSKPVGTARTRAAVPGVPLTLRISLVGDGTREMKHTYTIMDWVRAFPLDRGRQVSSGKALRTGRHTHRC